MKITHISYGKRVTASKMKRLHRIAAQLGAIRAQVWHQYGATKSGSVKSFREIRDLWIKNNTFAHIPARLRNETLRDSFQDIILYKTASLKKVWQTIHKQYQDKNELKTFQTKLRLRNKKETSYLHRLVRKHFKHGKTSVNNQIILDTGAYNSFTRKGQAWIAIMSLERNKRICIPLNSSKVPTGTLRLILRENKLEVHYTVDSESQCNHKPSGDLEVGVDKGYTEVYTDSSGVRYGQDLGATLSEESDLLKVKYQRRNKIKAVKEKHELKKKHKKAKNIQTHNMGRKKLNKRKHKHTQRVKHLVHNATHKLFDKAGTVVAEDLTWATSGRSSRPKNMKRRLSSWVKGIIESSLMNISKRRSAFVIHVNAAYTSQVHSPCGSFGTRKGDVLYCSQCGVVCDADMNGAENILERVNDHEIGRYMTFSEVKRVLKRRERERLVLINPDSSCGAQAPSTESELPIMVNSG